MKKLWAELIWPFLKMKLLSSFSNKVTKILLYTGGSIVTMPLIEHLVVKVILLKLFGVDLPIDVPDVPAYVAGVSLMLIGAVHNLGAQYISYIESSKSKKEKSEIAQKQIPHDEKIIKEILGLLPYEDSLYWLEQAGYAGLRRDFSADLETCEKFSTAPFKLYNEKVEYVKLELINAIKVFNLECMGHLGAQENSNGNMYLPPFHWKSQSKESEKKYYEQVESVGNQGQAVKVQLDEFIKVVKSENFIV